MLKIIHANIKTMTGKDFKDGEILIEKGKIRAIGEKVEGGDTVLDAKGLLVLPGFIDAHCHIGIFDDGIGEEGCDGNEDTDPVTPNLRAIDAINPFDRCFREAAEHGITTVITGPGSANVIAGQFVAMKTVGKDMDDMMIKAPHSLKVALGENPKRVYGEQKKTPATRMATAALLREALFEAKAYGANSKKRKEEPDMGLEVLCDVLAKKLPLKIHAHRADDILTGVRICKEFDLDFTIDHCTEGHLILELIKEYHVKPILGPLICERGKSELRNLSMAAPAQYEKAGIPFALMTDHSVIPIQYLPVCATLAVREGLSVEGALRALTVDAAKITGVDAFVGTLEKGKDADLIFFKDNPIVTLEKPQMVFIRGEKVCDHT